MISVRERTRLIILRAGASLAPSLLVPWNAWRCFKEKIRSSLLTLSLTLIYFLLLAPLAWQKSSNPINEITSWKKFGARIGWRPDIQSTSGTQIYLSGRSSRDDLIALMRTNRIDHSTLFLYDVLSPLKFLAKPPKEKELSSDLYIMF
ncbi:MAG TPA: hypothetical protein VK503_06340 [Candidatus Bathyarchaeia archaeon]|nr:hypothetical protein [Candidatus Bathyarchaeia archaeon]